MYNRTLQRIIILVLGLLSLYLFFNQVSSPENLPSAAKKVKLPILFCLVLTHPDYLHSRVKHSYENCIKYCSDYRYVLIYDNKTNGLPYKFLHPRNWNKEEYSQLSNKVFNAIIDTEPFPIHNWYLIADDDTFIHMENLYNYIKDKDFKRPAQYGYQYSPFDGFLSGGASQLLSQEAYKKILKALKAQECVNRGWGAGDMDLSLCLKTVGVELVDTRDEKKRERFHPTPPEYHFYGPLNNAATMFPVKIGKECCADSWISFHDKNTSTFYNMIKKVDTFLKT